MQFGSTVGKACLSFVITNIDDAFVLVTFFAEGASPASSLTPLKITLGQYIGFTVIVAVSLVGFAVAVALPSEPIGFLGLLPILLGVWRFLELVLPPPPPPPPPSSHGSSAEAHVQTESKRIASAKSVLKVSLITVMNGGDNIGTYVPLFSQAKGAEIAVYVVVYYVLVGVWCLAASLIMKQKHILRVAERYASVIVPFLYIGLGIYIVVKSDCYPWSIDRINNQFLGNPGRQIMSIVTSLLLACITGAMVWSRFRSRGGMATNDAEIPLSGNATAVGNGKDDHNAPLRTSLGGSHVECSGQRRGNNSREEARPESVEGADPNESQPSNAVPAGKPAVVDVIQRID